ncbi:MAG: hypothetical protein ACLSFT_00945 [Ruminococcus callidus]
MALDGHIYAVRQALPCWIPVLKNPPATGRTVRFRGRTGGQRCCFPVRQTGKGASHQDEVKPQGSAYVLRSCGNGWETASCWQFGRTDWNGCCTSTSPASTNWVILCS